MMAYATGNTMGVAQNMADSYQVFRRFLRENGCERQFDDAFYEQCGANVLDETLAGILVIDEGFLSRAFRWDLTPEGRDFWKDLDRKWWSFFLDQTTHENKGMTHGYL